MYMYPFFFVIEKLTSNNFIIGEYFHIQCLKICTNEECHSQNKNFEDFTDFQDV